MSHLAKWGLPAARTVLGLAFFVFGLNYFLNFLPTPPPPPAAALSYLGGLNASGYTFPIIKAVEVAAGLALLSNRFVPLALTLLAPIIVNIVAFHFVLAPSYALPTIILALELYLAWSYRGAFAAMLRARVEPSPRVARQHAASGVPVAQT